VLSEGQVITLYEGDVDIITNRRSLQELLDLFLVSKDNPGAYRDYTALSAMF
jgi:hypothetical protein